MRRDLLAVGTAVRHADGQVIHRRGDADRALAVILEGQVSLSRLDAHGQLITVAVLGPGASFGEIPLLTGRPRTHDAVAVGAVRLVRIGSEVFRELLGRRPGLRDHFLAELASMLAAALDQLDSTQRHNVAQRVARFLADCAGKGAGTRTVAVRQSDIAAALGVTREAVAAALRRLREAQVIQTGYRVITLTNVPALRAMAAQD